MLTSIIVFIIVLLGIVYSWLFYPRQVVRNTPQMVNVITPNDDVDYHNDCLHPCIRHYNANSESVYLMVQSPWYNFNDSIENPLFYRSNDYMLWQAGSVISRSPKHGYNSDPNVYTEDGKIYVIWREYDTPDCREIGCVTALFIKQSEDVGKSFSTKRLLLKNIVENFSVDTLMCPILLKHNGKYLIYATWYQFEPTKKNLGVAIWESTSLTEPNFKLKCLSPVKPVWTVDKWHQLSAFGTLLFFPLPYRYDLWHFDLFEYKGKVYMISCEDKTDNIMLGVSTDYIHFETKRIPLINAHHMEKSVLYRQRYYKPTAFIDNDILHLMYTSNAKDDYCQNVLWHVEIAMEEIA